ncbi:MAG: hypothetical protein ACOY41_10425 [Pseudomonadota bacterium]
MKNRISLGLLALLQSSVLLAAPADGKEQQDGSAAPATTQTDVIGTQEAPGVFNVVPWKDKASMLPKKEVTTSILRETLQPLDPDVLRREIELQKRLEAPQ